MIFLFRELGLFFHSSLGGTSTCADGSTCAVIKPHAIKKAGLILNEIISEGKSPENLTTWKYWTQNIFNKIGPTSLTMKMGLKI